MPLPDEPRTMIRALMKGDRTRRVVGHNGAAATLAACQAYGIGAESIGEARRLLAYAYGYAVGLNEGDRSDMTGALCDDHQALADEGRRAGLAEDLSQTYRAAVGELWKLRGETVG